MCYCCGECICCAFVGQKSNTGMSIMHVRRHLVDFGCAIVVMITVNVFVVLL